MPPVTLAVMLLIEQSKRQAKLKKFDYTNQFQVTEEIFLSFHSISDQWTLKKTLKRVIIIAVSVLLLFNKYTAGIGVLFILLYVFIIFYMPLFSKKKSKESYASQKHLQEKPIFKINEQGFGIESETLNTTTLWNELHVWRELDGILTMTAAYGPRCYYDISNLKSHEIYDWVIKKCQKHGRKYIE